MIKGKPKFINLPGLVVRPTPCGRYPTVRQLERVYVEATLRACGDDKRAAAKRLGVTLRTIYNLVRRYAEADRQAG